MIILGLCIIRCHHQEICVGALSDKVIVEANI